MHIRIDPSAYPGATSIEIPAIVTICGCEAKELDLNHQMADGTWIHLCPTPKKQKKILLAAWYKNPVKNFLVNLKIKLQERRRSPSRPF